nr:sigma-70 family RNA polymerase sigma factor [Lachnospiraceae bacterium]MBQ8253828.1 sigma-70 family RNA polymerase sigma factor [Lachnospiraceae bacterium]
MDIQQIFERQHKRVYRVAMMMLQNSSDAEDAVQNVFLKFVEKGQEFKDEGHEDAWFITVTRNYCKDQLKNTWNSRVDFGEIPERPTDAEKEDHLLPYILKLKEKYREVIYLYYYEEYSVREMSKILRRGESTIQTQLSAARGKLRKMLEKEGAKYV